MGACYKARGSGEKGPGVRRWRKVHTVSSKVRRHFETKK